MVQYRRAGIGKRLVAAIVDGLIAGIPSSIPILGPIIGTLYILSKDALVYELTGREDFRNRSIGKKLLDIEVIPPSDATHVDWNVSVRRNIPLALGSIIMIIPLLGWIIGPIVGLVVGLVEAGLILLSPDGRRFGDQLGGTIVVESEQIQRTRG